MLNELTPNDTFCDYYQQWVAMYKEGAVRDVTLSKYRLTCAWLQRLIPLLTLAELNRITYQKLLNDYAVSHERQTTMDFLSSNLSRYHRSPGLVPAISKRRYRE